MSWSFSSIIFINAFHSSHGVGRSFTTYWRNTNDCNLHVLIISCILLVPLVYVCMESQWLFVLFWQAYLLYSIKTHSIMLVYVCFSSVCFQRFSSLYRSFVLLHFSVLVLHLIEHVATYCVDSVERAW